MKRRIVTGVILSLVAWSCNSSKSEKKDKEEAQIDTVVSESRLDDIAKSDGRLFHSEHEEDKSYPWYDTRYAGHWIEASYMDKLIEIFKADTTISLYEYVSKIDQCNGELLDIDIEGCAKDNIFYLKNLACNDKYISKSNFEIGKETSFTLKNIYSGKSYHFESPEFNELKINGKEFIQNHYSLSDIEETLDGMYVFYDDVDRVMDTVSYRNGRFEKSDTLSQMNLVYLTYVNDSSFHERPTLPHSDLVYVRFYTGESVTTEIVDDSGEGMGIFETGPATRYIDFDLKRTSRGFELHNAYDPNENKLIKSGLAYKFKRIGQFESKRRH